MCCFWQAVVLFYKVFSYIILANSMQHHVQLKEPHLKRNWREVTEMPKGWENGAHSQSPGAKTAWVAMKNSNRELPQNK